MSLISCYDAEGIEYKKEPVDARECCNLLEFTMHKRVQPKKTQSKVKKSSSPKEVNSEDPKPDPESKKTTSKK